MTTPWPSLQCPSCHTKWEPWQVQKVVTKPRSVLAQKMKPCCSMRIFSLTLASFQRKTAELAAEQMPAPSPPPRSPIWCYDPAWPDPTA